MTVQKSHKEPRTRHNCVPGTTNSQYRHRCRQNQTDKRDRQNTPPDTAMRTRTGGNPMTNSQPRNQVEQTVQVDTPAVADN